MHWYRWVLHVRPPSSIMCTAEWWHANITTNKPNASPRALVASLSQPTRRAAPPRRVAAWPPGCGRRAGPPTRARRGARTRALFIYSAASRHPSRRRRGPGSGHQRPAPGASTYRYHFLTLCPVSLLAPVASEEDEPPALGDNMVGIDRRNSSFPLFDLAQALHANGSSLTRSGC